MRPISASKHKMKLIPGKQNLVESNQDGKDINKNIENKKPCKSDKDGGSKMNQMFHDLEGFKYNDFQFQELPQNKVRCGICQVDFSRLIVHLNASSDCAKQISNMVDFKTEYSKYRNRQRFKKSAANKKAEDIQGYNEKEKEKMRAHNEKKRIEDPEGFKAKVNKW